MAFHRRSDDRRRFNFCSLEVPSAFTKGTPTMVVFRRVKSDGTSRDSIKYVEGFLSKDAAHRLIEGVIPMVANHTMMLLDCVKSARNDDVEDSIDALDNEL